MDRHLANAAHIGLAMATPLSQDIPPPCRIGMQGTMRPRMDLAFRLRLGAAACFVPLAGRRRGVFGVLSGSFSLSRRVAFSTCNSARCASNVATRTTNSSTRATNVAISASFSAADNGGTSGTKRIGA